MRGIANLYQGLCLCTLCLISIPGLSDDLGTSSPIVRAVLFHRADSPQSQELFAYYLPELSRLHGPRLEVSAIDVSDPPGEAAYHAAAQSRNLPPEPGAEPVVLVGSRSIVGLPAIAKSFGDNFEALAGDPGTSSWPPVAALEDLLPAGIQKVGSRVASEGVLPSSDIRDQSPSNPPSARDRFANGLAILVLIGMVAALIDSLAKVRGRRGRSGSIAPWALPATLLIGLGISAYTAYTALANVVPMCGPIGSCSAVQNSEYSKLFGVPMGVLGVVGYGVVMVFWLIARHLSPKGGGWHWLPWGVALFGVLFSLRLTALEPFVIGATCLWCLGSAVSMSAALWLLSGYARQADRAT